MVREREGEIDPMMYYCLSFGYKMIYDAEILNHDTISSSFSTLREDGGRKKDEGKKRRKKERRSNGRKR